jgi:hypothetical protein
MEDDQAGKALKGGGLVEHRAPPRFNPRRLKKIPASPALTPLVAQ